MNLVNLSVEKKKLHMCYLIVSWHEDSVWKKRPLELGIKQARFDKFQYAAAAKGRNCSGRVCLCACGGDFGE